MANSAEFSSFTDAFMRGFSFIDDINRRRKRERMLQEEMDRRRTRQDQLDLERAEDRAFTQSERDRVAADRVRAREATALLSNPDTPDDELQEFADIPEVAQELLRRRTGVQTRSDLELLLRGEGLGGAAAAAAQGGAGAQPAQQEQALDVAAASLPPSRFESANAPRMTRNELNAAVDAGELSLDEAVAIRDQQNARFDPVSAAKETRARRANLAPGEDEGRAAFANVNTEQRRQEARTASEQEILNNDWDAFADVNNAAGDQLRNLPPETVVGGYFDNRSSLSEDVRNRADMRIRPMIQEAIASQQAILQSEETVPGSRGERNAQRKLSEAYALANEIGVKYKPLRAAGVNARGLPLNNSNPQLTENVINGARSAPGFAVPPNPNTVRADATVLSRPQRGRVSERFAQAAFRSYKNGLIDFDTYGTLIRTGRFPAGAGPEFVQTDPKKDTWIQFPDGSRKLVVPARNPDKKGEAYGRNLIGEDGLSYIKTVASSMNTPDDRDRGTNIMQSFFNTLALNENRAAQLGYDLSSVNDVAMLFQRWTDLHVVRDAYNDEWFADGQLNPDFQENYGSLDEALFNPAVDDTVEREGLAVPGSTTLGFGGEDVTLNPMRRPNRDPSFYREVQRRFPELQGLSPDEIEAEIERQRQAQGR